MGLALLTKVTSVLAMGIFPIWDIPLRWQPEAEVRPNGLDGARAGTMFPTRKDCLMLPQERGGGVEILCRIGLACLGR